MAKQMIGYREILADLKQKKYKPVYFLAGEEPYYIDLISDYIQENVLTESEKQLNQYVVYGKDTNTKSIVENARRFPMMASYQVIIVKEAQNINSFDELATYLKQPQPTTILVFCHKYKKPDARKSFVNALDKSNDAVYFVSDKLYDSQMPEFIRNYMSDKNVKIDNVSVQLLADHIGTDLQRMVNELHKLIDASVQTQGVITPDLIEKNVGISKEFNVFELKTALIEKNVSRANFINTHLTKLKSFAITPTLSVLYQYFSKLMVYYYLKDKSQRSVATELKVNPFFVREFELGAKNYNAWKTMEIISLIRTYDAMSKGVDCNTTNNPPSELMRELVYKILH